MERQQLAQRIRAFLDAYAGIRPDWDPEFGDREDRFTSPDASMLEHCAELLSKGETPKKCWSEWGSGGYKPYTSKEGRTEHDLILNELEKLMKSQNRA